MKLAVHKDKIAPTEMISHLCDLGLSAFFLDFSCLQKKICLDVIDHGSKSVLAIFLAIVFV